MQLTIVLALVCFSHSVLCAPAVTLKQAVKDKEAQSIPSDTLELQLEGVPFKQPIQTLHETEAGNKPVIEDLGSNNNGGPEVKRSERVDADDVEDSLHTLSGNMKAVDQDVKAVLRTFFQNLKNHPEIVEDIIEREGAKLMNRQLAEKEEEAGDVEEGNVASDGVVSVDVSDFQQPSPQLIKSPKQVEKKTGAFPEYPRFIYKSPMRNMKERNQLTARSQNNKEHPTGSSDSNEVVDHNVVVNDGSDVKASSLDLSNAIPVIQQPSTKQEAEEEEANELLSNPEEGGAIDLAALEQAQEEYSKSHPFINTLPIFPDRIDETDEVNPSHETQEEHHDTEEKSQEEEKEEEEAAVKPSVQETEIVDTKTDAEDHREEAEPEEKRSGDSVETNKENNVDETEGSWSETQVGEQSKEVVPHQLTGSEIAAETLNNPVQSESSVTFRPYYYYYSDYNDDGEKTNEEELDVAEGGESEDNNEKELKEISSEGQGNEEDEEEEADVEHEAEEDVDEDEATEEDEAGEEEADDSEDHADDSEDHVDDSEDDEGVVDDVDEEETVNGNEDTDAKESEINNTESEESEESEETANADDNTNSKNVHVEKSVVVSNPTKPGTPRLFKSKGLMVDKNEADLLSLHGDEQPARRPIAGQPM